MVTLCGEMRKITELNQIDEYKSFIDKGVGFNPGSDFKKIRVHMVYAVKHDGRHKARLVAGGHLTEDTYRLSVLKRSVHSEESESSPF